MHLESQISFCLQGKRTASKRQEETRRKDESFLFSPISWNFRAMEVLRDSCEETKPIFAVEEDSGSVNGGDLRAVKQEDLGSVLGGRSSVEKLPDNLCVNNTRRSMLMPKSEGLTATTPPPTQLTIFYGGSVSVFDDIPPEKVHEILQVAVAAARSSETRNIVGPATSPSFTRSPSFQSTTALGSPGPQSHFIRQKSICRLQADLPIARRHSLQRFLEKRRDKFLSKGPYQAPSTDKSADKTLPDAGCSDENPLTTDENQPKTVTHLA